MRCLFRVLPDKLWFDIQITFAQFYVVLEGVAKEKSSDFCTLISEGGRHVT